MLRLLFTKGWFLGDLSREYKPIEKDLVPLIEQTINQVLENESGVFQKVKSTGVAIYKNNGQNLRVSNSEEISKN